MIYVLGAIVGTLVYLIFRDIYIIQTAGDPERRWIRTIYGKQGEHETPYLTRVKLTPCTPWGQAFLHCFHRGDQDPDPHDHPWAFYTFPLQTYIEERLDGLGGYITIKVVDRWKWHYRPATYTHRVLGPGDRAALRAGKYVLRRKRLWTIIWKKRIERKWGFWVYWDDLPLHMKSDPNLKRWGVRYFVPWKVYIYGQQNH